MDKILLRKCPKSQFRSVVRVKPAMSARLRIGHFGDAIIFPFLRRGGLPFSIILWGGGATLMSQHPAPLGSIFFTQKPGTHRWSPNLKSAVWRTALFFEISKNHVLSWLPRKTPLF